LADEALSSHDVDVLEAAVCASAIQRLGSLDPARARWTWQGGPLPSLEFETPNVKRGEIFPALLQPFAQEVRLFIPPRYRTLRVPAYNGIGPENRPATPDLRPKSVACRAIGPAGCRS
jgi:hypothetical protein